MMEVIVDPARSIVHLIGIHLTHCHKFLHFQYNDTKFYPQLPIYWKFVEFQ